MTPEELLADLMKRGAVLATGHRFQILVHAELVPAGLFYVALPAENQSHAHVEPGPVRAAEPYLVVGASTVASILDTPELNSDDALEELATFRANLDAEAWSNFLADIAAGFADAK